MKLIEILSHCNKIEKIDDLLNNYDLIVELAKLDVKKILKSKQIRFPDFEFSYSTSVLMTKDQLSKKYLTGSKRFLNSTNINDAIRWLISRLVNNMRNSAFNRKYKLYLQLQVISLDEKIISDYDSFKLIEQMDLKKFNKETIKHAIKKIWKENKYYEDFDKEDLELLCNKFNIKIDEIIECNTIVKTKKGEQVGSGNFQLVLNFEH